MQTTTTSKQFTLNLTDFWKGLILAVVVPIIGVIKDSIDNGALTFNWKMIGTLALSAILGYLLKNLFTPSAITVKGASAETVAAVKEGTEVVKVGNTVAPTNK